MRKLTALIAGIALVSPALAQQRMPPGSNTAGYPITLSDGTRVLVQATTPIDTAGNPAAPPSSAAQGSSTAGQTGTLGMCATVTGDQAYTVGTTNPLNCIATGRLKVGLSSAGNIDPAAQLATTLTADLVGCKNRATTTMAAGQTAAIRCNDSGAVVASPLDVVPVTTTGATAAGQILYTVDFQAFPGFAGIVAQKTSGVGSVVHEVSNDNANWTLAYGYIGYTGASSAAVTGTTTAFYAKAGRYMRARVLAYTSGTINESVFVSQTIPTPQGYVMLTDRDGNYLADVFGQYVVNKPSPDATTGVAPVATGAASGGVVLKASSGNLYGLNVTAAGTAGFVMVFNSATVPADGAVTPAKCIPLAANTGIDLNFRAAPTYLSAGVSVAFSTTGCFTKTASATAFISGDTK